MPSHWYVSIGACLLLFAGHLLYGANTNASALAFSALWLVLGGASLIFARRGELAPPSALMILAGLAFGGVCTVVASQLAPAGQGGNSMWRDLGSAAFTIDRDATLRELAKLVSLSGAFAVGYVVGASDRRTRLLAFLVVTASGVYAGWAFVQHFTSAGMLFGAEKAFHLDRLTASFLSANTAATALGMLAIFAAARIARAVKESASPDNVETSWVEQLARKAGVAALALLLLVSCIVETRSRFGIAVSAAALMILFAWEVRAAVEGRARAAARNVTNAALVGGVLLAVFAVVSAGETVDRLGAAASDADSRMTAYQAHFQLILASPWRGHGLGSFPALNAMIQTPENHPALEQLNALHNVYLQWMEEAGIAGAALMFGCIGCLLAHIWGGFLHRASMRSWLRAVLIASLLVMLHGLVDYGLQVPSIAWQWALWLGVGCGVAAPRPHEQEARQQEAREQLG
jgi:O-antigen ligase